MRNLKNKLGHAWWKSSTFVKNIITALISLAFFASFIIASSFWFWIQVKIAEFMFG